MQGMLQWRCKNGHTNSSVSGRLKEQESGASEYPVVLLFIKSDNSQNTESLIHEQLFALGKHQSDVPGKE